MAMCNIPSTNTDPSYRYRMPKIISQNESRGRGKKTRIVNMGEVARAIKRPPQYTTQWFGIELGAQSTYNNKEGEGERSIVNGHHDTHVFQTCLDKFLDKYVLCPNCHLPEIDLIVKNKHISAKCMACGWTGDLDNGHKLAAFVVKHPPDESGLNLRDSAAEASGGKLGKKERRAVKQSLAAIKKEADGTDKEASSSSSSSSLTSSSKEKKKKKEQHNNNEQNGSKGKKDKNEKNDKNVRKDKKAKATKENDNDDDKDDDIEKTEQKEKKEKNDKKDKTYQKHKKDSKEKKKKKTKKDGSDDDSDIDDDESDTGGKGQASKKKNGELQYDDDEVKPVISILAGLAESKGTSLKAADYLEELTSHRLAKNFDQKTSLYITMEALCGNEMDAKALEDKAKYFDKLTESLKLTGTDVLWALGAYLDMNPSAKKVFAQQLKVAYERDWAEEKTILEFYNGEEGEGTPAFATAQQAAGPCLKWLAEAEEEDDDDDNDESDD